ncbi:hypothetical protein GCM10010124_07560 [Pilimelia terevasa]|uniref:Uncharacterized protein n=2 Tax=Pilimelia terevasa TaxID=53372 RepID=A0A8J3BFG4_9ACTN|nr:hypothetical protein GCM10010124_07560 [Pilimelia terevasa]
MVMAMPDTYNDPSGNTAQFQAFVTSPPPAPAKRTPVGLIVGGVVLGVAVLAALAWALA